MKDYQRVLVFEANQIVRVGLVKILSDAGVGPCTGYESPADLSGEKVGRSEEVLCLLNPGEDEACIQDWLRAISAVFPDGQCVLYSNRFSVAHMGVAMRGGAAGYVLTSMGREGLVKSLEVIAMGGRVMPVEKAPRADNGLQRRLASVPLGNGGGQDASLRLLSKRELEILRGLSQGMSNKLIARQWDITEATVKVHVKAILRKIHAKNRTEAAYWAWDNGLLAYAASESQASRADC